MNGITDTSIHWPAWSDLLRVLTLADYNTRVVVIGVVLLGVASGVIGTFMLLRKRALMGDAVSHATLPGIGIAFLVMTAHGGTGRSLAGLLLGAAVSGLIGMGAVLLIRAQTRLKEDAALGIVLSVFFGLGVAVLGIVQQQTQGHAAGLESFIYGKTASMLARDAALIAGAAAAITFFCCLLYKEFALICFDQEYAAAQGWAVTLLDVVMMGLVVLITVIGLQAVGLILMIALLIIPPAAARFWTPHLRRMVLLAAVIGGIGCFLGAILSALLPRLPAGAIIVVVSGAMFLLSMVFGVERGVLKRAVERVRLRRTVQWQHLLRALYEWNEARIGTDRTLTADALVEPMPMSELQGARTWPAAGLRRLIRRALRQNRVRLAPGNMVQLTAEGFQDARRIVRNHRLWETYLITHADIAPVHVDRNADEIEHVLGRPLVARLEGLLDAQRGERPVPPSPHVLEGAP